MAAPRMASRQSRYTIPMVMVKTGPGRKFEAAILIRLSKDRATVRFEVLFHHFDIGCVYRNIPAFVERNPFRMHEWTLTKGNRAPTNEKLAEFSKNFEHSKVETEWLDNETEERVCVPDTPDGSLLCSEDFDDALEISRQCISNTFLNHPAFDEHNTAFQKSMCSLADERSGWIR